jgi:hypothetical protein
MKKLLIFLSLIAVALTGCLDSEEDVTIQADGSGTFQNTIDMSGLFDMMQMAAMTDTSANSQLKSLSDKDIDSTVSLRSFTDTATTLTTQEKALLQNGTMHININQKEKIFKISMVYPFKKVDDLQKILELQQSGKGFNPFRKSQDSSALSSMDDKDFPTADQVMNITYKKGLIERKMDQQKIDSLKNKEDSSGLQGMDEMMESVTFGTVIHLPRAVKTATGDKLSVSDDKKTVRIKYTLADLKKNPKSLEFKVTY